MAQYRGKLMLRPELKHRHGEGSCRIMCAAVVRMGCGQTGFGSGSSAEEGEGARVKSGGGRAHSEPRPQQSGCAPLQPFCNEEGHFHNHRMLPRRAHRLRSGPSRSSRLSSRLAYDLNSFMSLSGRTPASTTACTCLVRTCPRRAARTAARLSRSSQYGGCGILRRSTRK